MEANGEMNLMQTHAIFWNTKLGYQSHGKNNYASIIMTI